LDHIYKYSVIDTNYSDKVETKFETEKLTSKQIDSFLRQGKTTLKITRQGEGKEIVLYHLQSKGQLQLLKHIYSAGLIFNRQEDILAITFLMCRL
jgi:hypothetical protein